MMAGRPDDQQAPRPEGKGGVFPCTLMQERLWSQVRSGHPYGLNVAMRWLVTGRLSHDVAQRALQAPRDARGQPCQTDAQPRGPLPRCHGRTLAGVGGSLLGFGHGPL